MRVTGKRRLRWTATNDATLARLRASGASLRAMTLSLHRTVHAVRTRLARLRLVGPGPRPWLVSDEAKLVAMRGEGLPLAGIAARLNRTVAAVASRVAALSLARREHRWGKLPGLVRRWHTKGLCDTDIAQRLKTTETVIRKVRLRIGLPVNRLSSAERVARWRRSWQANRKAERKRSVQRAARREARLRRKGG